jgi:hypothetical protein
LSEALGVSGRVARKWQYLRILPTGRKRFKQEPEDGDADLAEWMPGGKKEKPWERRLQKE